MPQSRGVLPQLESGPFLADGGIETSLIFLEGLELPDFAAFTLQRSQAGREALLRDFRGYAQIARNHGVGLLLESATWRASADWGRRLGYTKEELAAANRDAIAMLEQIRREFESPATKVVISGCIGPRGDGYDPGRVMTPEEAEAYHEQQIGTFAGTEADLVTAITMTSASEATGIARAARKAAMPVVLSFTVETDGRLPTGQRLTEAIREVDAATDAYPAYFMLNCAHPSHFAGVVASADPALARVRGVRANASRKSHAELNASTALDIGDPAQLAADYASLKTSLPGLTVLGGCCGTDPRHIEEIAKACLPLFPRPNT
jgi:S-methylmethionine-dependent homocysteine/selenocysteine methylase